VTDDRLDVLVRDPIGLADQDVLAIAEFLRALTDPGTELDPALLTVPGSVPSGLEPVFGLGTP
jgi:hypothetical protein